MMGGMFAGVVPAEKQGPLCDACVGIFEQVNELLDDPAFQDQVHSVYLVFGNRLRKPRSRVPVVMEIRDPAHNERLDALEENRLNIISITVLKTDLNT